MEVQASPTASGLSPSALEVAHIGHVELLTPAPEDSLRCFTEVLGLREVDRSGDSVYLRGESDYERYALKLTAAPSAGLGHLGLRARSAGALECRVNDLRAAGAAGEWTDGDHGHGPAFRFADPDGHVLELYWETERYAPPAEDPPLARDRLGRRGGPGVATRRLDHVNLLAADVERSAAFAWQRLGFSLLDELRDDAGAMSGAWLSLGPRPLELIYGRDRAGAHGRLHHLAFWVDTREEVLRAADIFVDQGVAIEVPPAQHTIGRSFFLYGLEPGGNRIEVTTGADLVLDPDPVTRTWTAAERRRGVGWGTVFPPSWHDYATPDVAVAVDARTHWEETQRELWGRRPEDWSQLAEPQNTGLFADALDAAGVTAGSAVLDVGCGSGLALSIAARRGAVVSGIDISGSLLAVARRRVPGADLREGGLDTLPFDDGAFDVVVAVNALQFAFEPAAALREVHRVLRPGGRLALGQFAAPERCESTALHHAMEALIPADRTDDHAPYALSAPGALEAALGEAGLTVMLDREQPGDWRYEDLERALRGLLGSAGGARAIALAGEERVRAAVTEGLAPFATGDGAFVMHNHFRLLVAERAA